MSELLISDCGPVRVLSINRPERRNALSIALAESMTDAISVAGHTASVGALVITGSGGHFSSGGDANDIVTVNEGQNDTSLTMMRTFHRLILSIWESELPVIAAVSGVAYGGAFNLALSCDLIYCASDSRFCQVFLRRSLTPDLGGAYFLPRLIGMQRAKELMFLTEEITAARALELGIINRVLPDYEATIGAAISVATDLANGPRGALAITKRLLNASSGTTLGATLELEALAQAHLLGSSKVREGFATFINKDPRPEE